jgi:hypothetical protein
MTRQTLTQRRRLRALRKAEARVADCQRAHAKATPGRKLHWGERLKDAVTAALVAFNDSTRASRAREAGR